MTVMLLCLLKTLVLLKNISIDIYQLMNVNNDIETGALYNFFTFYYVLHFTAYFGPEAVVYKWLSSVLKIFINIVLAHFLRY